MKYLVVLLSLLVSLVAVAKEKKEHFPIKGCEEINKMYENTILNANKRGFDKGLSFRVLDKACIDKSLHTRTEMRIVKEGVIKIVNVSVVYDIAVVKGKRILTYNPDTVQVRVKQILVPKTHDASIEN